MFKAKVDIDLDGDGHRVGFEAGYLKRLARGLLAEGIDVSWETLHDMQRHTLRRNQPAEALMAYAENMPNGLLVVATKGRAGLRLSIKGSTTHHLITHSPVPVLVTHRNEPHELEPAEFLIREDAY